MTFRHAEREKERKKGYQFLVFLIHANILSKNQILKKSFFLFFVSFCVWIFRNNSKDEKLIAKISLKMDVIQFLLQNIRKPILQNSSI